MPDPADFGPDPGGPPKSAGSPPRSQPRSRPRGQTPPAGGGRGPTRRDKLAKVENRLNQMFAGVAVAQAGLSIATQDPRHELGADVTAQLSPQLVAAWVNLARENDRVADVLIRMSETSAWGEVTLASVGFVYSQAQAYGAVPRSAPNPWVEIPVPAAGVPAGDGSDPRFTGAAAAAGSGPAPAAADGAGPIAGRQPPESGVDAEGNAAHERAERERKIAEEQRRQQQQGS